MGITPSSVLADGHVKRAHRHSTVTAHTHGKSLARRDRKGMLAEHEEPRMLISAEDQHTEAAIPPIMSHSDVVSEERAAKEEGEKIEDMRWFSHMKAYCSASFAGGLTVGVAGTLLLLSIGPDCAQGKKRSSDPERSSVSRAESGNQLERKTNSVESIHRFMPRLSFLVGMLLVQSLSSLMLAGFQDLIQKHPSIVFFLTMIVGTGGNVGGQSVVLAVRRLAYGEEVSLREQIVVGLQLSAVLAPLALLRAYAQGTKMTVCLVIGFATVLIVIVAAALGTALPKLLNRVQVDPAHATPVIQVLMDMVGVLVTCVIGYLVLDVMFKVPAQ
jgi:cation transporter-like permease